MSDLEIRKGAINPSACLSEGWALIKPHYGIFLGMTIVLMLIAFTLGFIPYVGQVINAIISGPLLCGIYYALIVKMRGEEVRFSMMFEGFSRFLSALFVTLVSSAPWLLLGAAAFFFVALNPAMSAGDNPAAGFPEIFFQQFNIAIILSTIAAFLVSVVLQILLFFSLPLIADRNLGFIDAVKLSVEGTIGNIGGIIVLFILQFLVLLLGILAFCIGFLFALPIIYAANIVAYRSVFPGNQPTFFNEPPRPDAYDTNYGTPQQ